MIVSKNDDVTAGKAIKVMNSQRLEISLWKSFPRNTQQKIVHNDENYSCWRGGIKFIVSFPLSLSLTPLRFADSRFMRFFSPQSS
jgi:hypothetical protein